MVRGVIEAIRYFNVSQRHLTSFCEILIVFLPVYLALRYMCGAESRSILPSRWDFMSITLLSLGIGSFLFHASLRQTLEFADEPSMLGLTWSMLRATLIARQRPSTSRSISVSLTLVFAAFSVFYVKLAKIIYQVIAFASGIALVTLRSQYLFHRLQLPFPKDRSRDWNIRTWQAIGACLFGYLLWNIDLEYCGELRKLRKQLGLPWAWLLEFHGWWHILTAVGADRFMNVAREVNEEVRRENIAKVN
jgi:dihydroceramidase